MRLSWGHQTRPASDVAESSEGADVEANERWRPASVASTPPRPTPPSQQRVNEGKPPDADVSVRRSRDQCSSHDQELILKFCFWFLFALFSYELVQWLSTLHKSVGIPNSSRKVCRWWVRGASRWWGALPPVDLQAIYLVRAICSKIYYPVRTDINLSFFIKRK
jgi:hypothetical protein